jgi:hypothetical protein
VVGSPGSVTITPSPTRSAASGTAFGTVDGFSGMPDLWP